MTSCLFELQPSICVQRIIRLCEVLLADIRINKCILCTCVCTCDWACVLSIIFISLCATVIESPAVQSCNRCWTCEETDCKKRLCVCMYLCFIMYGGITRFSLLWYNSRTLTQGPPICMTAGYNRWPMGMDMVSWPCQLESVYPHKHFPLVLTNPVVYL